MWKNIETDAECKTYVGALWSGHRNEIRTCWNNGNYGVAVLGFLFTPVLLDLYKSEVKKTEYRKLG